jgi:hypothetical protein
LAFEKPRIINEQCYRAIPEDGSLIIESFSEYQLHEITCPDLLNSQFLTQGLCEVRAVDVVFQMPIPRPGSDFSKQIQIGLRSTSSYASRYGQQKRK